jgi:hypothetical protein
MVVEVIAWVGAEVDAILGAVGVNGALLIPGVSDSNSTSVVCAQRVADWRAEEQVLLCLAQPIHILVGTASVMRIVLTVSVVRAYSAHALMTRGARCFLPSVLLALLIELMVLLLALLDCVIEILYQRATAE